MIQAPNVYSPFRNPERARQRRDLVLRLMREEKKIDDGGAEGRAGRADHAPQPRRGPDERAALRRLRQGRARRALRREAEDRGPADLHDPRRGPAAGGPARGHAGARESREEVQAARLGRASRRRSRARSSCSSRRRARVRALVGGRDYRALAVQPRDAGAPPAGLASSSRSSTSPRSRGATCRSAGHAGDDPDGLADHRRVGPEDRRRSSGRRATTTATSAARCRRARRSSCRSTSRPCASSLTAGLPYVLGAARAARGSTRGCARYPSVALGAFEISPMEIAGAYCGLRQQRRPRRAERDRRRHDRRRHRARPQGDAADAGAAGRRGLPRRLASCGAPSTAAPATRRARGGRDGRPRGQDGHDERRARRLVRRASRRGFSRPSGSATTTTAA